MVQRLPIVPQDSPVATTPQRRNIYEHKIKNHGGSLTITEIL